MELCVIFRKNQDSEMKLLGEVRLLAVTGAVGQCMRLDAAEHVQTVLHWAQILSLAPQNF